MMIREMVESDIREVQKIAKISWNDTYEGIIPVDVQENFLQIAYSNEQLTKRMNRTHFFVAQKNEQIVGFANFLPVENGVSELAAIYLYPNSQRSGIGTALFHKGIETLNLEKVIIHVEKANKKAISFYKKKGFQKISEFENNFFGHPTQIMKMMLDVHRKL